MQHTHTHAHIVPVKSSPIYFCKSLSILWIFKEMSAVRRRLLGKLCELIYSLCQIALNNSSTVQKWRSVTIFNDKLTNVVLFIHSPLWNYKNLRIINSTASCALHQNILPLSGSYFGTNCLCRELFGSVYCLVPPD